MLTLNYMKKKRGSLHHRSRGLSQTYLGMRFVIIFRMSVVALPTAYQR